MAYKDTKYLLANVEDLIFSVQKNKTERVTSFFDPAQQQLVEDIVKQYNGIKYDKFGGYGDAERLMFYIYPFTEEIDQKKWYNAIKVVKITWNAKYYRVSHRDILGAIMGLGIQRHKIGDIIIQSEVGYVFTLSDIAPFIFSNLIYIGKASVNTEICNYDQIYIDPPKIKLIKATVSTLRLDSIASAGFGISRNKMVPTIRSGAVKVNWTEVDKPNFVLKEDDMISVQHMGRIRLAAIGKFTKKQRINVTIERFI